MEIPDHYLGPKLSPSDEEDRPEFCYPPMSKLAVSPTALAYCHYPPYDMRQTCPGPSSNLGTFTFMSGEEWSDEHVRCVKAALEYYNQKNGTDYEELVRDVTFSNCFLWDGTWFHINFRAKQVVDGKDSHRGFFAEIRADVSTDDSPLTQTFTVTACLILEAYGTNHVCDFCPNVLHPDQGFLKRRYKYDLSLMCLPSYSPAFPPNCPWWKTCPEPSVSYGKWSDEHLRRVKAALEYYNKKNGTDYEELVHEVTLSDCFISDGTWFHLNFTAKQAVDGTHMGFFAEIRADVSTDSPMTQTLTVTACLTLEGDETSCDFCTGVVHPRQGFFELRDMFDPKDSLSPISLATKLCFPSL